MAPRAFERPATIALSEGSGDSSLALEGLHVPVPGGALGGAVIAPPHPLYGGSMESPVVTEVAHACEHAEIESLRFNWRGVGASAGKVTGDTAIATADYSAALDWIEETVEGPVAACGYSFGAGTAVRAAVGRVRVQRLLLVAPPPAMIDPAVLADFRGAVDVVVGDRDEVAPLAEVEKLVASLANGRLAVIPECDHFFMNGIPELARIARSFLGEG